ncbi:ankyrin repeat domain-containing protein [Wolbachia endosymbiont of Anurida maritima]|uniref:ankyrin repeat domain-containing protein n=1 Tax=Wolbachia endosymbiont of Anurida maritima TaxID=2850562 RepID=UPI0035CEB09B
MPYENSVAYFGRRAGNNTAFQAQNHATSRQLSESTKQLFKAIDDENLEDFKLALEGGADVNAFDKGYTPLMTIIMNGDDSPICLKMMMLLLQHQSLNINAQKTKECNTALHLAFLMENRNFVQMLFRHPNLDIDVKNSYLLIKPEYQQLPEVLLHDFHKERFFHTPKEYIEKIGRIQEKDFSHLTMEIQKARKGRELLSALSSGNIYQAKRSLNQEFNPNCWKRSRSRSEEIETPLSLIIKSCLQEITPDNEEVLTKFLKHKELDFSQIKPIQAIEQNPWVKQIIEQAITERLTATINKKDLDDVKKLVEDNCFMSHAIVTAALRDASEPTKSIKKDLNEKFPASAEQPVANTHNVQPETNDAFIAQELQQLENLRACLQTQE